MEVTYALGAEMLLMAGLAASHEEAWSRMRESIGTGKALNRFRQIVEAQGGDPRIVDDQSLLPSAPFTAEFVAVRDGYVAEVTPRTIGYGIIAIGGGRRTMEDTIDPAVGFVIDAKPGDAVRRGDVLATIHARDEPGIEAGRQVLAEAISIGNEPGECLPLISLRITAQGKNPWVKPSV